MLLPALQTYIKNLPKREKPRTSQLRLRDYLLAQGNGAHVSLVFICTHNSRRSHFAQVWAQTMAWNYGWHAVETYSAGTEQTAVYASVFVALEHAGMQRKQEQLLAGEKSAFDLFSKTLGHRSLPHSGFVAITNCDHAQETCPVVHGASEHFHLPYQDPKHSDGTTFEASTYQKSCAEIAADMKFIFKR